MFSIHSSFPELVTFVNRLAPKTITPITTIDRAGFHKLLELTKTNVIYLNDKHNAETNKRMKKEDNDNNTSESTNQLEKNDVPVPPPLPPNAQSTTINAPRWKNWNQAQKARPPKKAKIEPLFSQSQGEWSRGVGEVERVRG